MEVSKSTVTGVKRILFPQLTVLELLGKKYPLRPVRW